MTTPRQKLRTDAARNVERIVIAAHSVFANAGLDGAMEDVAESAGVGVATVYRRFPTKDALLRVVVRRRFDDVVEAALRQAEQEADPREAMRIALTGAVTFMADDPNIVAAASSSGLMTMDLAYRFVEPVAEILCRGQSSGVFRSDLVSDDVVRIVLMLIGTMPSFHEGSDGWRRYLDLIMDMLCASRTDLSAASAVRDHNPQPPLAVPTPDTTKK